MNIQQLTNIIYVVAAVLFIFDLKMLSHPRTAVRGNKLGSLGMVLAIAATLISGKFDWTYIILGIAIGSIIGAVAALKVKMTSMPEMVAIFNGFGGASSLLVGWAEYHRAPVADLFTAVAIVRERERGNLELLITTPVRTWELMLGKLIPYIAIGLIQVTIVLLVGRWLFHVPMRGHLDLRDFT